MQCNKPYKKIVCIIYTERWVEAWLAWVVCHPSPQVGCSMSQTPQCVCSDCGPCIDYIMVSLWVEGTNQFCVRNACIAFKVDSQWGQRHSYAITNSTLTFYSSKSIPHFFFTYKLNFSLFFTALPLIYYYCIYKHFLANMTIGVATFITIHFLLVLNTKITGDSLVVTTSKWL